MTRTAKLTAILHAGALASALCGQGTAPGTVPQTPRTNAGRPARPEARAAKPAAGLSPSVRPGAFGVYREQTSRELFAACDLNSDDHITLREATKTLKGVDLARFRTADTNHDGRLQFGEFDRHFKSRARYGGQLVLTELGLKRLDASVRSHAASPVLMHWFSSLDQDGNDRLDFVEWKRVGTLLGKDARARFVALDKDLSDSLTVGELEPMLSKISLLDETRAKANAARGQPRPLPAAFRVIDRNADGLIDLRELERALERIHPCLVRHAARILAAVDRNADAHVDVFEIDHLAAARRPTTRPGRGR